MNTPRLAFLLLVIVAQAAAAEIPVIHVSPDGDDSAAGLKERPLRTLAAAQRAARKAMTDQREGRAIVVLRGGTYYLGEPLVFTAEDSGIEFRAAEGERPVVSGGIRLDVEWKPYRDGIFRADVSKAIAGDPRPLDQLFVDGQRQHLARYPNYDPKARVFDGTAADCISPERARRWANPAGGFVHALHAAEWGGFHYVITGVDEKGNVKLEGGQQNNRRMGMHPQHRFVENIFEELDAPGEWYLDRKAGVLYFMPPAGVDLKKARIELAGLQRLVELRGTKENPVRGIKFVGLTFTHAGRTFMEKYEPLLRSDWCIHRGGAVLISGAEDCAIEGCNFDAVGGNAIFVSNYNRRIDIHGCRIVEAGASGVCFVGDPAAVRMPCDEYGKTQPLDQIDRTPGPKGDNYPAWCRVEDCLITRAGRVEKQVAGVQIAMSDEITVSHCSIYDLPRAGINIGDGCWGGHVIEHCDVFDTVKETGDHGSFNSWGRDRYWLPDINAVNRILETSPDLPLLDAQKPVTLRNNRWRCDHGWDVDLDDGSSNYQIYNNLFLNGGLKLREGFNRAVRNNIMVNNTFHPHVWFAKSGDVFMRNIVQRWYAPIGMPARWGHKVDENLLPDAAALERSHKLGLDEKSLAGDPMFVDPAHGDFRVRPESPAIRLGFENFAMDEFGVTSPALRAEARTPLMGVEPRRAPAGKAERDGTPLMWQGVRIKNIVGLGEVSANGLTGDTGVWVMEALEGSAGAVAGLRKGDVILKMDGKDVADCAELLRAFWSARPGAKPRLTVRRTQADRELEIPCGEGLYLSAGAAALAGSDPKPTYDNAKDFLGCWQNAGAWLEWKADVPRAGKYRVQLILACADDSAGSECEIESAGQKLRLKVPATGGWEKFVVREAGILDLPQGESAITLKAVSKPGEAVTNLRGIVIQLDSATGVL